MTEKQPRPRAGHLFVEEVNHEYQTASGLVLPEDTATHGFLQRVRVTKKGPPEKEQGIVYEMDFQVGDHVCVPLHAGRTFSYFNQSGREETLWMVHEGEVKIVFDAADGG